MAYRFGSKGEAVGGGDLVGPPKVLESNFFGRKAIPMVAGMTWRRKVFLLEGLISEDIIDERNW